MKKKIETESGFKCTVDDVVLDDMRLVDLIASLEEQPSAMPRLVDMVLGTQTKENLYKHLETSDGRVPVSLLEKELAEILQQLGKPGEAKK